MNALARGPSRHAIAQVSEVSGDPALKRKGIRSSAQHPFIVIGLDHENVEFVESARNTFSDVP